MTREQSIGTCDHCGQTFRYYLIHNGFGDSAFAYFERCTFTLVLDDWAKKPAGVTLGAQQGITEDIEPFLKPCPCGGQFRAQAEPRCPHCCQILSASKAKSYIEKNAPGTNKGWTWQGTWDGIYSIVIEDRVVHDGWKVDLLE